MQRVGAVAELTQDVPGTGRVGAAGDEHGDRAARRNQLLPAHVRLDTVAERLGIHPGIVPRVRAAALRRTRAWRAGTRVMHCGGREIIISDAV